MLNNLKVGDKVRCIADKFCDEPTNPFRLSEVKLPKKGMIYTVREIVTSDYGDSLKLEEIKNPKFYFDDIGERREPIFGTNRFEKMS